MGLGKFLVSRAKADSFAEIVPDFGDVAFVKRRADGSIAPDEPMPIQAQPLPEFLKTVRKAMRNGGQR